MKFCNNSQSCIISSIYARCNNGKRLELWEKLEDIDDNNTPWIIGGEFDVILNEEEKMGGLDFSQNKVVDFGQFISKCALSELRFVGSSYIWWNERINEDYIMK